MAQINIPLEYKDSIAEYCKLNAKQLKKLSEILSDVKIDEATESVKNKISDNLSINSRTAANLLDFFNSILRIQYVYGYDSDELVDKIIESLSSEDWVDIKLPKNIKQRLSETIIHIQSLRKRIKSKYLEYLREKTLSNINLISDIRPIFDDPGVGKIFGSIIIHTLVVDYYENRELKQLHLALDLKDIKEFIKKFKRAEAKDQTIRNNLKESVFNPLNISKEL